MLKRIKRLYKLSKKDPLALEELTDEQIDSLPDADLKAEFLGEGTEEEFKEMESKDKFGVGKLFDA